MAKPTSLGQGMLIHPLPAVAEVECFLRDLTYPLKRTESSRSLASRVSLTVAAAIPLLDNGPEGRPPDPTDIPSFGGISGVVDFERVMFLVGVLFDDSEPSDPAPPRLDFTGDENFAELSPALNQTFFIGDGLTGTGFGSEQTFHVPDDATRLYLGFADAFAFQGLLGWYDDNTGSLTAAFTVAPQGAVPEPGTLALLGLGAARVSA